MKRLPPKSLRLDPLGHQKDIVGAVRNITEQVYLENQITLHEMILRNMAKGVVLVKAESAIIVYTNPRFESMFGYRPGELIGQPVHILNHPTLEKSQEVLACSIIDQLQATGEASYEILNRKKDGTSFWCRSHITTFDHPEHGQVWVGVHETLDDQKRSAEALITAQKKIEAELRESRYRYAEAAQMAKLGHWGLDYRDDTVFWSSEIYNIFGLNSDCPAPNFTEFLELIHPDDRAGVKNKARQVRRTGKPDILEYRIVRPDGEEREIYSTLEPVVLRNQPSILNLRGTLQDITERRRLERRLNEITWSEREMIRRDIHDSVCQELSGIAFIADSLRKTIGGQSQEAALGIEKIIRLTEKTIEISKNIAWGLAPLSEHPEALIRQLDHLAEYITDVYGIHCRFESGKEVYIQDKSVSTQLFLIAREAAINAAKHAEAVRIRISLSQRGSTVTLKVADNGIGHDVKKREKEDGGIKTMKDRAALIGAGLSVQPNAKKGMVVICRWQANARQ